MNSKYENLIIIRDNLLKQHEFSIVNNAFKSAHIPMAPIKGMALLYELPEYAQTRPMCDIDILIKKEDFNKAKDILLNLNYAFQDKHYSEDYYLYDYHHLPFYGKNMVELHWYLAPPRPNNIALPELWAKTRLIKYREDEITLLSPEDTILSLGLHLRRFNDPFSLKYIKDICEIIKKHDQVLDWGYILKYSRLNRLNSLLYYALISVKINTGYPVPNNIINMFYPGALRASLLKFFINSIQNVIASDQRERSNLKIKDCFVTSFLAITKRKKYTYVFLRFLLYNRAWDFIKFIILLPEEEFSRFYLIKFPSKKSSVIYSLRFFAMPFLFFNARSSKKLSI
ncbi:MAG: nucleotidyltransferase family protein [Candidatus Omnitrophota bacterium]|nr:nucleotidyltransferase family protein [Candidatus Omnitrophota bacterium]